MLVKFKRYNENAVIPQKAYDKDFCYDLVAVSEEEIAPNVWKYGFGFGIQIERGWETIFVGERYDDMSDYRNPDIRFNMANCPFCLSVDIRARSSVWKTGMVLSNGSGTIDENYTGEISAVFYHVNKDLPRYRIGDRVAQAKIGLTIPMDFREVTELQKTDRNDRGYGSTGQ